MNKLSLATLFFLISLLTLNVSCEGTFTSAPPGGSTNSEPEAYPQPTTPGIHLFNDGSEPPISYSYIDGTNVEIPGRDPSMMNASKVFAGWCSSLPCETLNQRTHLTGQRIVSSGPLSLYALWINPTVDWQAPLGPDIIIPYGVTEIPDSQYSYGLPVYFPTVVISDSVTVIKEYAFISALFDHITIPNSVVTLETGALCMSQHTKLILPSSVTTIGGDYAAGSGDLRDVTIGSNVSIASTDSFPYDLKTFYDANGRLAGKYRWDGSSWDYSP